MPTEIETIAATYRGTHDIGGVAAALVASGIRSKFDWVDKGADSSSPLDKDTEAEILKVRKMNCYEFVHFCGYLSGIRRTISRRRRFLWRATGCVMRKPYVIIPGTAIAKVTSLSRGALVAGIDPVKKKNNAAGFFHIGIATGTGTTVVHLINEGCIGSDDLKSADLTEWFDAKKYSTLWLAGYDWRHAQGDTYTDPLPTAGMAGAAGTAAVGSPSVAAAGSVTPPGR